MATADRRLVFVLAGISIAVFAAATTLLLDDDTGVWEQTTERVLAAHSALAPGNPVLEPPTVREAPAATPQVELAKPAVEEPTTIDFESEVIDGEHQQPIGGASILARTRSGEIAARGDSTGNGRFLLAGLENDVDYRLEVAAAGFVVAGDAVWIHTGRTAYTSIRMRRVLALTGRVVDDEFLGIQSRLEIRRGTRRVPLTTGNDGAFRIDDLASSLGLGSPLPERIGGMRIRSDLHRDAFREITRADLELGRPLEITVERGARIAGRIVAQGGVPLRGVEILAYPADGARDADLRIGHSHDNGSFEISGLRSGRVRVEPQHVVEGLVPALRNVDVDLGERGEHAGLELAYVPGLAIRGRVVNERDESALPGMLVTLHHDDWLDPTELRTDLQGHFVFEPLPEGIYSVVLRGRAWRDPREPKIVEVAAGRDDIWFKLDEPRQTASARVELRDRRSGEPVVGSVAALVRLLKLQTGDDGEPTRSTLEIPIDDSGKFMIDRLAVGRHRIDVMLAGYATDGLGFEIAHDGEALALELSLVAGVEVRGRVFDENGTPIEGAKVDAFRSGAFDGTLDPETAITTDRDGRFTLFDVAPDAARIAAFAPGFAPISWPLAPEHAAKVEIELRLARGSAVGGVLRYPSGAAARHFEIELVGTIAAQVTTTDADGRFLFEAVEPGRFRIRDSEGHTLENATNDGSGVDLEIEVRQR